MNLDFIHCSAQELYDAAHGAQHVFHNNGSIGVTRLGDWFHVFDLNGDTETKLAAEHTTPERLQAHAVGFLRNRSQKVNP